MQKRETLIAIGEALIDFIPKQTGESIKNVEEFQPRVGGAPANVCGAFTRLGGTSEMITQLGSDPFGDKIMDEFIKYGIGCQYVKRTNVANTSLAFVALEADGNREFSFYRKPGADMLLEADSIEKQWFKNSYALHFCSVSLGEFPMKEAHEKAIEYAREQGALISFDPNVRLPLWENKELLRKTILEFIPMADILKISDEELEFITGREEIEEALEVLFCGNVSLVLYTEGSSGAKAYTRQTKTGAKGVKVDAVDTTGAGDAFIGSFLYQLCEHHIQKEEIETLSEQALQSYLEFSNQYCAKSVMERGSIASYPAKEDM